MLLAFILFDKVLGDKLPVPENPNKALEFEHERKSEYLREHGEDAEKKRCFGRAFVLRPLKVLDILVPSLFLWHCP